MDFGIWGIPNAWIFWLFGFLFSGVWNFFLALKGKLLNSVNPSIPKSNKTKIQIQSFRICYLSLNMDTIVVSKPLAFWMFGFLDLGIFGSYARRPSAAPPAARERPSSRSAARRTCASSSRWSRRCNWSATRLRMTQIDV